MKRTFTFVRAKVRSGLDLRQVGGEQMGMITAICIVAAYLLINMDLNRLLGKMDEMAAQIDSIVKLLEKTNERKNP